MSKCSLCDDSADVAVHFTRAQRDPLLYCDTCWERSNTAHHEIVGHTVNVVRLTRPGSPQDGTVTFLPTVMLRGRLLVFPEKMVPAEIRTNIEQKTFKRLESSADLVIDVGRGLVIKNRNGEQVHDGIGSIGFD